MNLSEIKKLRRDLCRTVGHNWESVNGSYEEGHAWFGNRCSRCKKVEVIGESRTIPIKLKYSDIQTRKFDILDRARKKLDQDIINPDNNSI